MSQNIIQYCQSELRSFCEKPFCDVDSLVLSQLSYAHFERLVDSRIRILGAPRLAELNRAEDYGALFGETRVQQQNRDLFIACAASPRFRDLRLFGAVSQLDAEQEKQFAALCFLLPDGSVYAAFRGTDGTLIGWKEDFNMSFRTPVPAQQEAASYLLRAMRRLPGRDFRTGGHSKGGNLAVYAAVKLPAAQQNRLLAAYSHDGPGFRRELIESAAFAAAAPRIQKTVPQSAVVGMLMQTQENYRVVRSDEFLLGQHDPFSWQIENGAFVTEPQRTDTSEFLGETLAGFLETLPDDKRERLVNTVFHLLETTGATHLSDLGDNWREILSGLYEASRTLDPETRQWLQQLFGSLCRIAADKADLLSPPGRATLERLQAFLAEEWESRTKKDHTAAGKR